jgi:hypothetical protein
VTNAKTWDDFRHAGLLWFVNRMLHLFGWAIVVRVDDNDKTIEVYPARVDYFGFSEEADDEHLTKFKAALKKDFEP